MSVVSDLVGIATLAGPYIIEQELEPKPNSEKLAAVTDKIQAQIEQKGGLDWPAIVPQWVRKPVITATISLTVTGLRLAGLDKKIKQLQDFLSGILSSLSLPGSAAGSPPTE